MDKPIKVSVAITFYNQQEFVQETLESVLKQKTNFDFEIVVGDDRSSDDTPRLIQEYVKKYPQRIKAFHNPKNLGVVLNIKNMLDHAQGQYLALLGGDDLFASELKLQKQFDFLEANPAYGLVHTDMQLDIENKDGYEHHESMDAHFKRKVKEGDVFEDLIFKNFIGASSVLFRKELYTQYARLDEWCQLGFPVEDFPMWLSFAKFTKFGYISEPLTTYRILNNSISRPGNKDKYYKFCIASSRISYYFYNKYGLSAEIKEKFLNLYYVFQLQMAFHFGETDRAKEALDYFNRSGRVRNLYKIYYWGTKYAPAGFLLKCAQKHVKRLKLEVV